MQAKRDIEHNLFNELSQLIDQSQQQVVAQANSTLTLLFWHVGNRINQNKRAEYSKQIVSTMSAHWKPDMVKTLKKET